MKFEDLKVGMKIRPKNCESLFFEIIIEDGLVYAQMPFIYFSEKTADTFEEVPNEK